MRKQSLIHLHQLLAEVVTYCREKENISINLDVYTEKETQPTSVNHSKEAHKEAVFALADALSAHLQEEMDIDPSDHVSAAAD